MPSRIDQYTGLAPIDYKSLAIRGRSGLLRVFVLTEKVVKVSFRGSWQAFPNEMFRISYFPDQYILDSVDCPRLWRGSVEKFELANRD
jgi:hypothetical protein